jgi:hypothetical protein
LATVVDVTTNNYDAGQSFAIIYPPGMTISDKLNTPIGLSWNSGPPSGSPNATGTLIYSINKGSSRTVPISTGVNQYLISDLSGFVGDVSCTLIYTDNSYNTVTYTSVSPTVPSGLISYTTSFGFSRPPGFTGYYPFDLSVNSTTPLVLDNSTILGIGYSIFSGDTSTVKVWRGNKFNSITFFKGILNTTANPVTFVANIYYMPVSDYYNSSGGFGGTNYFYYSPYTYFDVSLNLSGGYPIAGTSAPYTLAGNTSTTSAELKFSSILQYMESTLVIFQITSGSGTVEFATYNCFPDNYATAQNFTALKLTNANSLINTYADLSSPYYLPRGVGIVCNFNLV